MTMRLGTDTGSGINHIYSRMTKGAPEPKVGMGVTILCWTDREAGTIAEVHDLKGVKAALIGIRYDNARVVAGSTFDGSARYEYDQQPDAPVSFYKLHPKLHGYVPVTKSERGRWITGRDPKVSLLIGRRDAYRDPSF